MKTKEFIKDLCVILMFIALIGAAKENNKLHKIIDEQDGRYNELNSNYSNLLMDYEGLKIEFEELNTEYEYAIGIMRTTDRYMGK